MRLDDTTLTQNTENVYTSPVAKKNRQFKMDDETYEKLTAISKRYKMKRAAIIRLFIHEKYALYRAHGMPEQA